MGTEKKGRFDEVSHKLNPNRPGGSNVNEFTGGVDIVGRTVLRAVLLEQKVEDNTRTYVHTVSVEKNKNIKSLVAPVKVGVCFPEDFLRSLKWVTASIMSISIVQNHV